MPKSVRHCFCLKGSEGYNHKMFLKSWKGKKINFRTFCQRLNKWYGETNDKKKIIIKLKSWWKSHPNKRTENTKYEFNLCFMT